MAPLFAAERAERLAELALSSSALQSFSWRSVALLVDIARGSTNFDPDQARQFAEIALRTAITAEIAAMRQASATGT